MPRKAIVLTFDANRPRASRSIEQPSSMIEHPVVGQLLAALSLGIEETAPHAVQAIGVFLAETMREHGGGHAA